MMTRRGTPHPHLDDKLLCGKLSEAASVLLKTSRMGLGVQGLGIRVWGWGVRV